MKHLTDEILAWLFIVTPYCGYLDIGAVLKMCFESSWLRHLAEMYCLGELGLETNFEAAEEFPGESPW